MTDEARKALSGAIRGYYLLGLDTGVLGIENPSTEPIERWERRIGEATDGFEAAIKVEVEAAQQERIEELEATIARQVEHLGGALDGQIAVERLRARARSRVG